MYVQPNETQLGPSMLAPLETIAEGVTSPTQSALSTALAPQDSISRMVPPWLTNAMTQNPTQTAMFGPLGSLMQQLMQMLQSMMGYGGSGYGSYGYGNGYGGCGFGGTGNCGYGGEQYFNNANGSSTGDPHLSFNGNHWNSMVSQPDLLNSDSIPGGFQVSTQVTPPNARGVTWNQSASVELNNGQTTISMNNEGQPQILSFGQNVPISAGQTVQLGNGASVTCNANGSLSVLAQNGYGGQITTTLTAQGQGVNVETSAQNVDLGGALVNGNQSPPPQWGSPRRDPWEGVTGTPIVSPPPVTTGPIMISPPAMSGTPIAAPPLDGSPILASPPRMHPN